MADADRFPDGFTLGHRHRRPPGRGRQLEQRLVGVGAHPGSACAEPSGDACDQLPPLGRGRHRPASPSSGFDNYRFSLEWSRIEPEEGEFSPAALDHYRRVCDGLPRARHRPRRHLPPLHDAPLGGGRGAAGSDPDTADRFARFCERATAAPRRPDRPGVHDQRAEHRRDHRLPGRRLPARASGTARGADAVNDVFVDAHRKAVEAIRAGARRCPVGLTLSMSDYQAVDGGESRARRRSAGRMEDVFLEATAGDDFVGVQTYTRTRVGPDGGARSRGRASSPRSMGYEFWPEALEATHPPGVGGHRRDVPMLVTENGIGTDDDSRRIEYVQPGARRACCDCLDDGIDVLRLHVLEPARQLRVGATATGPASAWSRSTGRPSPARPKPSAPWLGEVARANALLAPPSLTWARCRGLAAPEA